MIGDKYLVFPAMTYQKLIGFVQPAEVGLRVVTFFQSHASSRHMWRNASIVLAECSHPAVAEMLVLKNEGRS